MATAARPVAAFDTLTATRKLEKAGFPKAQAEAVAETTGDAISHLCTKEDLANGLSSVRAEVISTRELLASTKETLTNEITSTRESLASTKEALTNEIASTKEVLTNEIASTKEILTNEIASNRREIADTKEVLTKEIERRCSDVSATLHRTLWVQTWSILGLIATLAGIGLGIAMLS